jgi:hypothetical protein
MCLREAPAKPSPGSFCLTRYLATMKAKKTDLGYVRQQTSGEAGAQGGRANSRRPWHSQYPGALLYADGAVPKAEFPRGKIRLGELRNVEGGCGPTVTVWFTAANLRARAHGT